MSQLSLKVAYNLSQKKHKNMEHNYFAWKWLFK